jgi:undecaprenyl-diphosphatase
MRLDPLNESALPAPIRTCARMAFVALLVLAAVAVWVRTGSGVAFDHQLLLALRSPETGAPTGPAWLPAVARDLTALGSAAVLIPLNVLMAAWLYLRREPIAAVGAFGAGLGAYGVSTGLKQLFGRVRPEAITHLVDVTSPSFPSGHATASTASYLAIALLLVPLSAPVAQRRLATGAALAVLTAVGGSRVYLGVHFPTDVIAGWATGTAWAMVCVIATRTIAQRRDAGWPPPTGAGRAG